VGEGKAHQALAYCSGFTVEAVDGVVGEVETPLFPPDAAVPDYLIIRAAGRGRVRVRRPVLATLLVDHVDPARKIVRVHGRLREITMLPEHLPLAL
jgi:hypothetical protein